MLKIDRWHVPAHLSRHIGRIVHVFGVAGPPVDYILPDINAADVAIHVGDAGQVIQPGGTHAQPRRLVVGALSQAAEVRHGAEVDTIFISLPAGCACMLGVPAAELRDIIAPLDSIAPELDAALGVWTNAYRAGQASPHTLVELLAKNVRLRCDRVVREIAGELSRRTSRPVASLAAAFGLSRRQVDRRFGDTLGRTPREFRRIARFARAWRLAGSAPVESWTALAATAGYFDQSHLIRDFRVLTRETPKVVFPEVWYEAFEPSGDIPDVEPVPALP
jgi:AraC-like DNA-binding protein